MTDPQPSWQDAYRATLTPEERASAARTKRWIWIAAIVLAVWIAVVLLAFTVFGTQ
jgi:hypothetical protein